MEVVGINPLPLPAMSFVHPGFLWALTALAIPVIIHLFQLRRYKRIDFPNIRLLQEVEQQTRARKKVQHWLVLLARLGAITALVLAFAQPYIPQGDSTGKLGQRTVSIYVDNSFSMDGQNGDGRLLDQARRKAQEVIMAHAPTDRFQVLTTALSGREQVLQNREDALDAASQVEAGPHVRKMSQVMVRQREALAQSDAPVQRLVLLSDLQKTTTDPDAWLPDTTREHIIVPLLPDRANNIAVDSVWFEIPVRRVGTQEVVHVRIRNHGDLDLQNVPLRLSIDGRQRAVTTFGIGPGAVVDTTLRFLSESAGPHWGEVVITDEPIRFDDRMTIAWRTIDRLNILLLTDSDPEGDRDIKAVFGNDSLSTFTMVDHRNVDLSALSSTDLVLLNGLKALPSGLVQSLEGFMDAGGSVAVFPGVGADLGTYNAALASWGSGSLATADTSTIRVDRIDLEQPFFRDIFGALPRNVDLPKVRDRYRLMVPPGTETLLRLQTGDPFLARRHVGKGNLYLSAATLAPQGGTFTRHALFVTSLLRMAELSRPMGTLYHTIGADVVIPMEGLDLKGDRIVHVLGPDAVDIVPEIRRTASGVGIILHDTDLPSGPYAVVDGTDTLALLGMNVGRTESDLSAYSIDELRTVLKDRGLDNYTVLEGTTGDLSISLKQLDQGVKLWKWCILLALLFLAAETLLIQRAR